MGPQQYTAAMNPVRIYDYLTKAREKMFDAVRDLPPQQHNREFTIGLKTFGTTLTHMMIVEWAYTERMQQHDLPPYDQWPIQDEKPPVFCVIEKTWREQAPRTAALIRSLFTSGAWEREFEYISQSRPAQGDGKLVTTHITASPADIFTQLTLHEIHHRAQVMAMLRQCGKPLENLDFSYMMFKRQQLE
jgi:uncharacterized damage-inducible protein DinB